MRRNPDIFEVLNRPFSLFVSIPKNHPEMAISAQENGADSIKVHLNVEHFASGTRFGSWDEEKNNIEKILESVTIPVGLLPGAEKIATTQEVISAQSMGITFLDAFAHHMPTRLFHLKGLAFMLAVNREYDPSLIRALERSGMNALEATILTHDEYGRELNMRDVAMYGALSSSTGVPVLVPTQKKIRPEDIQSLHRAGVRGIIIGAVVTGKTVESLGKTVRAFRDAINALEISARQHYGFSATF